MSKSTRSKLRFDYSKFHSTSDKVEINETMPGGSEDETNNENNEYIEKLIIDIESISCDIDDFIEEHQIVYSLSSNEFTIYLNKINELRSLYRKKHIELKRICNE